MMPLQIELIRGALTEMSKKIIDSFPNFLTAVIIFVLGLIISVFVAKMVKKAMIKLGIDKFGKKLSSIDIVEKSKIKISLSGIISKIIYYFLLLFFAVAATSALGLPEVSELVSSIFEFIPHIVVALIVLVVGTLFADAVRAIVHTTLTSLGISTAKLIANVVFYFLFINILISALSQAKVDTEFLSQNISIVIAGVVLAFSIGYGLASKETMANLISSFYSKNIFKIGDFITIDGVKGKVIEVNKSSITLETENSKIMFPLNKALSQKIEFHN